MTPRALLSLLAVFSAAVLLQGEEAAKKSQVRINLDEPVRSATSDAPAPPSARPKTPEEKARAKAAEEAAKAAAAKAAAATAKSAPAKKTAAAKIEGLEIPRGPGRGFLGVEVKDNHFVVGFYDEHRKPVVADVSSISVRWPVRYQSNPERTLLTPTAEGTKMTSEKAVRAPFNFRLYLGLLKSGPDGTESSDETYAVEFVQ